MNLGWLRKEVTFACPVHGEELTADEASGESCPFHEEIAFAEHGGVRRRELFILDAPPSRDVLWLWVLHGMNTRGWWQEDLTWLVSRSYGRMVPVAIHKYGVIRPGVIARYRQRALLQELIAKLRKYSSETLEAGFGGIPDVIAHSFGTWLLGHALVADPGLRVGRVVLLGSILRPDFSWTHLHRRGQVQAVLNHYGTKDFWSQICQRCIPCSGPSGREGFDDPFVLNVPAHGFRHSDFFLEAHLAECLRGTWQPFLTSADPTAALGGRSTSPPRWRQGRWRLTYLSPRCSLAPVCSCRAPTSSGGEVQP